ncbi:DUF2795 domain-containing protein [Streptomyces fulvoviolaceus]|uniref:DUF2795 domain-containing protein n=1 Tax=Streptomyces fulvoviolaceus TaxID=285535 RepID=UPI0004C8AA49|nr:DUF2795 domain-containing protein [Streptomyces fulvoviolaceus]
MQRGSDRLSRHRDDEMKHELQGLLRSGHPTRTAEWHDPEPAAEDDPEVWGGTVAPGRPGATLETVRLELARILGRGSFPATPPELAHALRHGNAPDVLVEAVEGLPPTERYATVQELARELTGTEEPE